MASRIVAQGLENSGKLIAGIAGTTFVQAMSWDSSTGAAGALTSGATALNSAGAVGTFAVSLTTRSTQANQTIRWEGTLSTAEMNGSTIGRMILHHAVTTAPVTSASNTIYGGIDQQSILKTSEYVLNSLLDVQYLTTQ